MVKKILNSRAISGMWRLFPALPYLFALTTVAGYLSSSYFEATFLSVLFDCTDCGVTYSTDSGNALVLD